MSTQRWITLHPVLGGREVTWCDEHFLPHRVVWQVHGLTDDPDDGVFHLGTISRCVDDSDTPDPEEA